MACDSDVAAVRLVADDWSTDPPDTVRPVAGPAGASALAADPEPAPEPDDCCGACEVVVGVDDGVGEELDGLKVLDGDGELDADVDELPPLRAPMRCLASSTIERSSDREMPPLLPADDVCVEVDAGVAPNPETTDPGIPDMPTA